MDLHFFNLPLLTKEKLIINLQFIIIKPFILFTSFYHFLSSKLYFHYE
jgi:hypothetical protein